MGKLVRSPVKRLGASPLVPSSLSVTLASPVSIRHRSGTEILPFSLCSLFLALLPSLRPLRETLSCPEARSRQGRGIRLPGIFTGQLRGAR